MGTPRGHPDLGGPVLELDQGSALNRLERVEHVERRGFGHIKIRLLGDRQADLSRPISVIELLAQLLEVHSEQVGAIFGPV